MADVEHDARADWSLLQQVTRQLAAATTTEATLQALLAPAPAQPDAELALWSFEDDTTTLLAHLPPTTRPPLHHLGDHHPSRPDAALRIPLTLRARQIGLLTIDWSRPITLTPHVLRIYDLLAHHAATHLDHLQLTARHQKFLADTERVQRLYATVMDHVPVGLLCIEGASRQPLLTNRMARVMLAGSPDPVSGPLSLAYMLHPGTDTPVAASELAGVRAALTGRTHRRDLDLLPPNSPRISVETIGVPVLDADGRVDSVVVVMADITGRKRAAEERARLQEEVIAAQAAALVERSTPLIPISERVLVMPLIGTIDHERGQFMLETALHAARERRARVTILDITGVQALDAHAVAALLQTAHALRLLGVQPVLSGVRPAVAAALADLDVSLAGVVTCGSLQAGIEYALRRRDIRT